jgi:hypothetical protein
MAATAGWLFFLIGGIAPLYHRFLSPLCTGKAGDWQP